MTEGSTRLPGLPPPPPPGETAMRPGTFDGSTVLVTGGGTGLGKAIASEFARLGASIVIASRSAGHLEAGQAAMEALGAGVATAVCDIRDPASVAATFDAAAEAFGLPDVLVNNAAANFPVPAEDMSPNAWRTVVDITLNGTFNCTRLAAAAMSKTTPQVDGERGAIVNFASVAAFDGQIGQAAYSATKAGIAGMTLPIARDLSSIGVRVNAVAPGLFDTPIYDKMVAEGVDPAELKAKLGESVLFPKRLGSSDELASLVYELLTNSYMNGETVRIDAGVRLPPK